MKIWALILILVIDFFIGSGSMVFIAHLKLRTINKNFDKTVANLTQTIDSLNARGKSMDGKNAKMQEILSQIVDDSVMPYTDCITRLSEIRKDANTGLIEVMYWDGAPEGGP